MNDTYIPEQAAIFMNKSHPTILSINIIAYSLEISAYIGSISVTFVYLVISKFSSRFHSLLRFQLCILLLEILIMAIIRQIVIFVNIAESFCTLSSSLKVSRDHLSVVLYMLITHMDVGVFLISIERFVAAYHVRTYESRFHSVWIKITILVYVICAPLYFDYVFFFDRDYTGQGSANFWLLMALNIITTLTHLIGVVIMRWNNYISSLLLLSPNRELSQSYQCRENLMVVRMLSPMFLFLFASRIVEFGAKFYLYMIGLEWGAVSLRIATHLYNQALALCFFLVPLLLLVNHPKSLRTNKATVFENNRQRLEAEMYFKKLQQQWENGPAT